MKVSAFVTSTRKAGEEYILSTITAGGRLIVLSQEHISPGAYVEIYGTKVDKEIPELTSEKITVLSERGLKKVKGDIEKFIGRKCKVGTKLPIKDKILNSLTPEFEEAAQRIKNAVFLHRPIIIRYHNDPDGLCSALALYFATEGARNIKFFMNTYPFYREIECATDIETMQHLDAEYLPPLFIACDFGAWEESLDQYTKLRNAGFEIMVIDHHPPHPDIKKYVDCFVSPFSVGGDSNHVAGLLTVEVAYLIAQIDTHDLHLIALTADRMKLPWFKPTPESLKKSLALDYLLQISRQKYTIEELAKTFADKEAMGVLYMQATERIDEMLRVLKPKIKRKEFSNLIVLTFSTDNEFKEGEFPGRGDMAEILSDELGEKSPKPTMIVGHGEHSMNFRLNTAALKAGVDVRVFINLLKEEMPHAIEAGGGHPGAASLRVKKGFAKSVFEQFLDDVEQYAKLKGS